TWPDGVIYSGVNSKGDLIEKKNCGDPHVKLNLSLGLIGWDFKKRTNIPLTTVVRIAGFGEYPYNSFILPHFALQIECIWELQKLKGKKHA
ncbi:MAG: hypothetical protein GY786_16570, partial [Proteobacteria bacterium]|nr:hypothetical protein [Pseudomonadota bacterium]